MADYYDRYERRAPRSREAALLRDLRGILSVSKARAATLRMQLKNIEVDQIKTRADLAQIPVLRKADLVARQKEMPPFGGACGTRPGALQHLLMSRDVTFQPEGQAKDWWNSARALFAAGIRKGDIILNCFSYHFTPDGHMIDSGLRALGCPVIPAGDHDLEAAQIAIDHYGPVAYCGPSDYLKTLLDMCIERGRPVTTVKRAFLGCCLTSSAVPADFAAYDIACYAGYMTGDLGIVAYESDARDGLIVNEGLIVEIVKPGTDDPLPAGQIGEIVVTRLCADYPLLRFGTGHLSWIIAGPSPCGRTNMRIRGSLGRVGESVTVADHVIAPAQIAEIAARHADVRRLRLLISGAAQPILQGESADDGAALQAKLAEEFFAVTKLRAAVEILPVGCLPADGLLICDQRPKQS
ncbi:phenylacetate--CoA ligase family protein [Methylovirgula sp. HY1]|uniref:phenylacetate--CoA ligase family protein n=1 Tax=Methylovirgula sp. HY1 TaxID=2822761 RepID=UPI001C5AF212|nr:phenylacetate--CoA ligase family protein [Methylovirgula sp. HY1]